MVTTKERKVIYSIIYSLEKLFKKEVCEEIRKELLNEIKECKSWLKGEKSNEWLKELVSFHHSHGTTHFRKLVLVEIEDSKTIKLV
jgi:hypothetical protein